MNIYVYSDESGVFDSKHNDYFVFGGLIILEKSEKDRWTRLYSKAEKDIRKSKNIEQDFELKATNITNAEKGKLFRSLNNCYKFGVVICQKDVLSYIFKSKKDKQRYLDYVYKIAVKRAFENLLDNGAIVSESVENLYFYVDEHTTATNGRYELEEGLEQEFKHGTYNYNYELYYPPIFKNLKSVKLEYCNSKTKILVRAADIVANKIYYLYRNDREKLRKIKNLNLITQPKNLFIIAYHKN